VLASQTPKTTTNEAEVIEEVEIPHAPQQPIKEATSSNKPSKQPDVIIDDHLEVAPKRAGVTTKLSSELPRSAKRRRYVYIVILGGAFVLAVLYFFNII